ncbi:N-acetylmuramoyl-L-alanine amidase [Enterococcus hirae]|uniref:N-acetylmuramoyl-L-alanine amidase n=1 Tax=Enterococcus hirae TaxID=1354 RepID=UPI0038421BDD
MTIHSNGGGHGGCRTGSNWMDPGAVGNGKREADVVRTITQKMQAIATVANTSDQTGTTINQNLQNQVNMMNAAGAGWAITNHLNAFNGQANGAEVWYWAGNEEARKKAAEVSATIAKALGIVDRGAKATTSLFVHRNTNSGVNVLLIEWCFIDNASDIRKLDANIDQAVRAVMNVFGYNSASGSSSSGNTKPKTHDDYVTESPIQRAGGQQAKLELMKEVRKGILTARGWQGADNHRFAYIFLMDRNTGKELARVSVPGIIRNDVNKHLGVANGLKYGMQGDFDMSKYVGKNVYIMFRRTNDSAGNTNGGHQDFHFKDLALTMPKR